MVCPVPTVYPYGVGERIEANSRSNASNGTDARSWSTAASLLVASTLAEPAVGPDTGMLVVAGGTIAGEVASSSMNRAPSGGELRRKNSEPYKSSKRALQAIASLRAGLTPLGISGVCLLGDSRAVALQVSLPQIVVSSHAADWMEAERGRPAGRVAGAAASSAPMSACIRLRRSESSMGILLKANA